MIDLNIVRIHDTPLKLVLNQGKLFGAFYYGDNFYRAENFTDEIRNIIATHKEAVDGGIPEV